MMRRKRNGQALVEFALIAPLMLVLGLGAVALDSFVQARSQLDHAVSRGVLVAARDAYDPCLPGDEPSEPGGFNDIGSSFNTALTSTLFNGATPSLTVTCSSEDGTANCVTLNGTTQAVPNCPASIAAWFTANQPAYSSCAKAVQPYDGGCFIIWRGGFVTLKATVPVRISWAPFWNNLTLASTYTQQIEPYRVHTCPASVPAQAC